MSQIWLLSTYTRKISPSEYGAGNCQNTLPKPKRVRVQASSCQLPVEKLVSRTYSYNKVCARER